MPMGGNDGAGDSWDLSEVPTRPSASAPQRIGAYEIIGELGRGSFGTVFRARDAAAGRDVAIKLLRSGRVNERSRERFLREAQVTAALRHPAILKVHASGEIDDAPWIAYELVEGTTLAALLEDPGLGAESILPTIRDVARGLGAAHAQGIVHRDVKPGNVLIDKAGSPRLADFGLASAVELGRLTLSGEIVGTPAYMAPEQLAGERDRIGPATDVWALGVILFEALTGELPFSAGSLVEQISLVTGGVAPDPRSIVPRTPPALARVCARALGKDPVERYPDGDAFADDLDRVLRGESVLGPVRRLRIPGVWWVACAALATLALVAMVTRSVPNRPGDVALVDETPAPPPREPDASLAEPPAALNTAAKPSEIPLPQPDPIAELIEHAADAAQEAKRKRAREGDPDALYDVARDFFLGRQGLPADPRRAMIFAQRAADMGHRHGLALVGMLLMDRGDTEKALSCFNLALERGSSRGALFLARFYGGPDAKGENRDPEQAITLYRRAIELEDSGSHPREAQHELALLLLERARPGDREEARELLRRAFRHRYSHSAVVFGSILEPGDEGLRAEALEMLRLVRQYGYPGHREATMVLGRLLVEREESVKEGLSLLAEASESLPRARVAWSKALLEGLGGTPSVRKAAQVLLPAARVGDAAARRDLAKLLSLRWVSRYSSRRPKGGRIRETSRPYFVPGLLEAEGKEITGWLREQPESEWARLALANAYREGWGVEKDPAQALDLYRSCRELPRAQFWIAVMYWDGLGGRPPDHREGRRWLERAAAGQDPPAMYRLAGLIKKADEEKALDLYERAARAGHPTAAFEGGKLALALERRALAEELFQLAVDGGHQTAKLRLARLRRSGD